jgi:Flp pilus assembly protein TadG
MLRENQTPLLSTRLLSSSRAKRGIWIRRIATENSEGFVLGWRSAVSAGMHTLQAFRAVQRLSTRIRVCLQAYRKSLKNSRALAAALITTRSSIPRALVNKWQTKAVALNPLRQPFSLLRETEAAALIEFAVALPLLVVLVVGIFDFGAAFNLKQELNNAVREGARFGAAQPTNDLALAQPPSVNAVRYLVDAYLLNAHINDCGLSGATWATGGGLSWVFTGTGGTCTMTLTVSRGVAIQETVGGTTVNMLGTTVSTSYPYQWHFNNVIQLLVPGANYSLGNIPSDATAVNVN